MSVSKLSDYGYHFQLKLIASLLSDASYISRLFDILHPTDFDSEPMRWLIKTIFEYFKHYKHTPTLDVFKVESEKLTNQIDKQTAISTLGEAWGYIGSSELDFIKNQALEFCQIQEIKNALSDSSMYVSDGKIDKVKERMSLAFKRGETYETGIDYTDTLKTRYTEKSRSSVTTGWTSLDSLLDGGLGSGELGVIVGPGGSGKSWVLNHLAIAAYKSGKHALYVTLELSAEYVSMRLDNILTKIPTRELKNNIELIQNTYDAYLGKITIEWFTEQTLSIVGLESIIEKLRRSGQTPDIVIIDYADLMKLPPAGSMRKDELLKELYQQLRKLAGEYRIPFWTASQSSRDSMKEEVIDADKLAESMGKHYTADFMMSIMRRELDVKAKIASFYVVKNRIGDDKIRLAAKMDTNKGILEIYSPASRRHGEILRLRSDSENTHAQETNERVKLLLQEQTINYEI